MRKKVQTKSVEMDLEENEADERPTGYLIKPKEDSFQGMEMTQIQLKKFPKAYKDVLFLMSVRLGYSNVELIVKMLELCFPKECKEMQQDVGDVSEF
jgi:hypothetical protein